MAKLFFNYSTMNAGKSTVLLQASHNYREQGMETYLLTARIDERAGQGRIASRIGIGSAADMFAPGDDLFAMVEQRLQSGPLACIFVDEAQFLEPDQVWQLARVVDEAIAKGTSIRDARALCDAFDEIGASRSSWAERECVRFTCLVLPEYVDRAVELQRSVVAAAEKAGRTDLLPHLRANLELYEAGRPCRNPWPEG